MKARKINVKQYRNIIINVMNARIKGLKDGKDLNLPYFFWGLPGIGKSKIIEKVCEENEWNMFDIRGSQLDPVDFRGMPIYDSVAEVAKFIRFNSLLPDENDKRKGIIFIDEFPQSPEMVMSASYQLINDRCVGDYKLPNGYIVFAAGNREEDGGVFFEMPPALKDRFSHVELEPDYDSFIEYVNEKYNNVDILSYLTYQNNNDREKIYNFSNSHLVFPTFRSWEKVLSFAEYGMDVYDLISDNIGEQITADYRTFVELVRQIPNAEELLKNKLYYTDIQKQIIASMKVTNYILSDNCKNKWDSFKYYIELHDPNDKKNKRQELTILFLLNLKNNFDIIDKMDKPYKMDKKYYTKKNDTIYKFLKDKFEVLRDIGTV